MPRVIETNLTEEDKKIEKTLRPQCLDDYIGQEKAKSTLKIYIEAAKQRHDSLDHVLFYGPPGLGKTTLAGIIANEMGVNMKVTSGPAIEKPGEMAAILNNLQEGDLLFVDEIHRLNRQVEEVLYPAMEDFAIDIMIGKGSTARSVRLDLPHFTLVGATTRAGLLTAPLRDRFGMIHHMEFYTEDELKLLKEGAEKIRDIETQLTMIEEKYPEAAQESTDGAMSVPAGNDMTTPPDDGSMQKSDDGSMQKFPTFEGKDLDGNTVKSDELFSANAVTVVNFWFTTCNPCVGELSELDALNKKLAEKGGSLIGVNTFTLDGDETAISEAKVVLAKKGATYQNVYFDSDGEAGKFTTNIFAYPTTYVVDRSGNIVGEPIVGAITEKKQAETLQKLIDQALAADMG